MCPETTTPERLLRQYEQGRLTAHGFILRVLSFTGKQRLTRALEILPSEILEQLKDFIAHYETGMRVLRGGHGPGWPESGFLASADQTRPSARSARLDMVVTLSASELLPEKFFPSAGDMALLWANVDKARRKP